MKATITCLNINCPERKGGKCIGAMTWQEYFDWQFPRWVEPQPGAGRELGALVGTGMYMQYDADRKYRDEEMVQVKDFITNTIEREKFDILVKILAECETVKDARECRHIIKAYILNDKT